MVSGYQATWDDPLEMAGAVLSLAGIGSPSDKQHRGALFLVDLGIRALTALGKKKR